MTKTQVRVLQEALESAKLRAAATLHDGERLWLHTWIIPRLADVIGRAAGHP